jgi:type IV pilus assembly protein PilE
MINCITTANFPGSNRLAGNNRGFTLIELLITITILAILAAIVIPSYNAQMHKTRRSDAVTTLLQIAQDLERCRSDTNAYDNAACTDYTGPANSQQGFYTITAAQAALTFTITAVPKAGTPQEDDSHCAQFTIDQTGLKTAQDLTPIDTTTDCWQ